MTGGGTAWSNSAEALKGRSRSHFGRPAEPPGLPSHQPGSGARAFLGVLASRGSFLGLVLFVATIAAYLPAFHAGFIWDDDVYVTRNPLLTAPDGLRRIWFSLDSPSQYCPLVYTSFRLERALWGLNPAGYHRVNILLHALNVLLLWRLLQRLRVPGAWLAAALFALHPVHVESVAWITERKNVLSLLFYLLALRAWVEFVSRPRQGSRRFYLLGLALYALALFSKATACTLPAALLLVLWLQNKPITRARLAQVAPFVLLGLAMGLLVMWWEKYHQGTRGALFAVPPLQRLLVASRAVWFYAGKLVWPAKLTFIYPRWTTDSANALAYAWLAAGIILVGAVYLARRFTGRSVEVALSFYVVTLSPLLGFIMLYTFRFTWVADHYQYAASIGPLALAAAGITSALAPFGRRKALAEWALAAPLLLGLGVLTWKQCGMYRDSETLWRTTIARNPDCSMAQGNLGFALLRKGRIDEAEPLIRRALELDAASPEAHLDLGAILVHRGRMHEAVGQLQEVLELQPDNVFALDNLAYALAACPDASVRDGAKAVELAQRATRLSGGRMPEMIMTLAAAYAESGRFPEAIAAAQTALELAVDHGNTVTAKLLQAHLELYRAGKPVRDPGR